MKKAYKFYFILILTKLYAKSYYLQQSSSFKMNLLCNMVIQTLPTVRYVTITMVIHESLEHVPLRRKSFINSSTFFFFFFFLIYFKFYWLQFSLIFTKYCKSNIGFYNGSTRYKKKCVLKLTFLLSIIKLWILEFRC